MKTARALVPALEARLGKEDPVLDKGFLRLVDYMGDDAAIAQAARISYGRSTKSVHEDRGLIRYLMRHRHSTPFEMCEIKFHIKMPIFVARQWVRHRTANINEYSARYSRMGQDCYVPEKARMAEQSRTNKQGCGVALAENAAEAARGAIAAHSERALQTYERLLNEDDSGHAIDENAPGLSRELARMVLPLNIYTEWIWKIDLHNLLHFIHLRIDRHAQWEIACYAERIVDVVRAWVPFAWEAFEDYRLNARSLSAPERALLRRRLAGERVTAEESGLSMREWREWQALCDDLGIAEG